MDYNTPLERNCLLFKEKIGKSFATNNAVLAGPKYCDMLLESDNRDYLGIDECHLISAIR